MTNDSFARQINENAKQLRELHDRIGETYRKQPHGSEHHAACAEFHNQYDKLAFPGGMQRALARLLEKDKSIIEPTIKYLQADPMYFYSGYAKVKMIRRLKHCPLTPSQRKRLAELLIHSVDHIKHREYQEYARLAHLIPLPNVKKAMEQRVAKSDHIIASRAEYVLNVLSHPLKNKPSH